MSGQIYVATQDTLDNWRHLAAVARAYERSPGLEAGRLAETILRIAKGGDPDRGGTGADVAVFGAQQITAMVEDQGLDWGELLARFPDMDQAEPDTLRAIDAIRNGNMRLFGFHVERMDRPGPRALSHLLGVLGGLAALVDPDGTRLTLVLDGTEAGPWSLKPRHIPEWRRRLVARLELEETPESTAREAAPQLAVLFPGLPAIDAARTLCADEAHRLRAAKLFHADADTSAVATRKAARRRATPLTTQRVPSTHGLIVFDTPIDWAPGAAPLAAASWGRQDTQDTTGPGQWWITLYVHAASSPPILPSGFAVITEGDVFADVEDHDSDDGAAFAVRAVVACWDVITQERVGKPVTEVTTEPRQPKKQRADRRRGITDDGTVRLVTIRGRRPGVPAQPQPADTTDGAARRYDRGRWWVTEHTRSQCMNPSLHQDGGCTHEDITVLEHPKGPPGKPFLDTVHLVQS